MFDKLFQISRHASHGVCRAVNVTGTTAAAVAGSLFKLVGAAALDASHELEYARVRVQDPSFLLLPCTIGCCRCFALPRVGVLSELNVTATTEVAVAGSFSIRLNLAC